MVDDVIALVERQPVEPKGKLLHLVELATSADINVDLAVRDWSRRDRAVAKRLRLVDNRRMDYMRSLFSAISPDSDDVEARCILAFSLWIGNPFIAAEHGSRTRPQVMQLAIERLLRPSSDPAS